MFQLEDGREHLYQWDLDRKILVSDPTITEVHFCNRTGDCSLVVETYTKDGQLYADIPNILLQQYFDIRVFAYCDGYTKVEQIFKVKSRSKPADYVYTETEVKRWEALEQEVHNTLTDIEEVKGEVEDSLSQIDTIAKEAEETIPHIKEAQQYFSNALKWNQSGNVIATMATSPVAHDISIKMRNKNLLDFFSRNIPYIYKPDGGEMRFRPDGGVEFSGTPDISTSFSSEYYLYIPIDKTKTYTLSVTSDGFQNVSCAVAFFDENNVSVKNSDGSIFIVYVNPDRLRNTFNLSEHEGTLTARVELKARKVNEEMKGIAYFQLEEGDIATPFSPVVVDYSKTDIIKYGKNICSTAKVSNGNQVSIPWTTPGTYTCSADVTVNKTDAVSVRYFDFIVEYTDNSTSRQRITVAANETAAAALRDGKTRHYSATITTNPEKEVKRLIVAPLAPSTSGMIRNCVANNIQVEVGSTATAFEPYKTPVTHRANKDGTVNGVTSYAPTTTLTTSAKGAIMDCSYNLDINKVMEYFVYILQGLGADFTGEVR